MKAKLLILVASLLVFGANVALAQRATAWSATALSCSQESCSDDKHCTDLGCTGCTDFPVGYRCYLQIDAGN